MKKYGKKIIMMVLLSVSIIGNISAMTERNVYAVAMERLKARFDKPLTYCYAALAAVSLAVDTTIAITSYRRNGFNRNVMHAGIQSLISSGYLLRTLGGATFISSESSFTSKLGTSLMAVGVATHCTAVAFENWHNRHGQINNPQPLPATSKDECVKPPPIIPNFF